MKGCGTCTRDHFRIVENTNANDQGSYDPAGAQGHASDILQFQGRGPLRSNEIRLRRERKDVKNDIAELFLF